MGVQFDFDAYLPLFTEGMFFVLLFFFSVYGLFLGYHWFSFGASRHTSMIALTTYLLGGAVLFLIFAAAL